MDSKTKELVENFKAKKQELVEVQERNTMLKAKADRLQAEIPGFERVVATMEKAKTKALDLFVNEQITQLELDEAKEAYAEAKTAHVEATEMLEAVCRAQRNIGSEINKRSQAVQQASIKMWGHVVEQLKEEAREAAGDIVKKAFVAARFCGADLFGNFIGFVFEAPKPDELKTMAAVVEQEYLRI